MPRLILLNGPPAAGKSTLALRYAVEHPMALALDIDRVRGMLGAWATNPDGAGVLARDLAEAMARTHLASGHDVVVPQLLGRIAFVERLDALAGEAGVPFVEVVLALDRDEMLRRHAARSAAPETAEHVDAALLVERSGGEAAVLTLADRVRAVVARRPATHVVESVPGDVEATYASLMRALG